MNAINLDDITKAFLAIDPCTEVSPKRIKSSADQSLTELVSELQALNPETKPSAQTPTPPSDIVITNAVQPKPIKQRFRVAPGAEVVGGVENLGDAELSVLLHVGVIERI
jgi:hypothetical protein